MKQAPEKFRFAAVAVDIVVFGMKDDKLCVLVDVVNRPPHYVDAVAFIGGIIDVKETADDAVLRHLQDKAKLADVYTEQLYTFSELSRDKRNRVISVSYMGIVRPHVLEAYTHETAKWVPASQSIKLAYDHSDMLRMAVDRLRAKLGYTTLIQYLLPKTFTLSEMQSAYELVIKKELDKRNFRKKVLAMNVVKETGDMQEGMKNRPAALYTFKNKKVEELPLFV